MKKQQPIAFSILILIIISTFLYAQKDISKQLAQITEKEQQIKKLDFEIKRAQMEYEKLSNKIDKKEQQKLEEQYKNERNQRNKIQLDIDQLKIKKLNKEIEILKIEVVIYDEEISQPVWAEGYGELIFDNNKTYEECKRLVLMYARRDAMEKGGKMIVESLTRLEKVETISKDKTGTDSQYYEKYLNIIKSKAMVEVTDQDLSGDYSKVKRVERGNKTIFSVKIRIKLKSLDDYNPYRQKLKELESE